MTNSELSKISEDSYAKAKMAGGFKNKSKNEITQSYFNERNYRKGDRLEKMRLDPNKYSERMKGNFRGSAYADKRPMRLKKYRSK